MNQYGYVGIGLLILLKNVFPPIPSEIILSFGGFSTTFPMVSIKVTGTIAASTAGSVLGALILYWIGTLITPCRLKALLKNKYVKLLGFKPQEIDKTMGFFDKHQSAAVPLGRRVPIARSLIFIPAGMTRMPTGKFILFALIGSTIWNAVLVNAGVISGEHWKRITEFLSGHMYVVGAVIVVLLEVWIVRHIRARRKGLSQQAGEEAHTDSENDEEADNFESDDIRGTR
jgi:membrane protein DedA with SNARE-associated domain